MSFRSLRGGSRLIGGEDNAFGMAVLLVFFVLVPTVLMVLWLVPVRQSAVPKSDVDNLTRIESKSAWLRTETDNLRTDINALIALLPKVSSDAEKKDVAERLQIAERLFRVRIAEQPDVEQEKTRIEKEFETREKLFSSENEARRTIVQIIGGLFFFATTIFSWRTVLVSERNLQVSQANLRATQDKQVSERFAKATESLGSDKVAVRLGGIHSLERIAHDSEPDRRTVFEVLCAYIRQSAPYDPNEVGKQDSSAEVVNVPPLPLDIQAILTILGRRPAVVEDRVLEIQLTMLARADLRAANFQNVDMRMCNLQIADLRHAVLRRSVLRRADLRHASLHSAILCDADLLRANLTGAALSKADLRGADLRNVVGLTQEQLDSATTDNTTKVSEPLTIKASVAALIEATGAGITSPQAPSSAPRTVHLPSD